MLALPNRDRALITMNNISFPHWQSNSDNLLPTLSLITNDLFIFTAFQIVFWVIVVLAYLKEKQFVGRIRRLFGPPSLEGRLSVKRGEQSWANFIVPNAVVETMHFSARLSVATHSAEI